MAKISGTLIVSSAPRLSKPSRLSNQPHWKIATRTPNAAPIESRFISTAFSGSSSERSITIRTRKLSARTKRTIFHIEPLTCVAGVLAAGGLAADVDRRDPAQLGAGNDACRAGGRPAPMAASDSLGALGVAWTRTLPPAKAGGATALTPGVASSVRDEAGDRGRDRGRHRRC